MSEVIAGIRIPDSKLAREATDLLREHGTALLFAHSLRVYLFGAARGIHRETDVRCRAAVLRGRVPRPRPQLEVSQSGPTGSRLIVRECGPGFPAGQRHRQATVGVVWDADRPAHDAGNPLAKRPEITSLVTGGVEADVLGDGLDEIPAGDRDAVLAAFPRIQFKQGIVQAFSDGFAHKPGNDIQDDKTPTCSNGRLPRLSPAELLRPDCR